MSIPPAYQPGPPARRGPSCWVVGGVSCLVVFLAAAALIGIAAYKVARSPEVQKLGQSFKGMMGNLQEAVACKPHMEDIRAAIVRYRGKYGKYPDNLGQLVPEFLSERSVLHCPIDPVKDPSHVTYRYYKPTDATPGSAPLLSFDAKTAVSLGSQVQTLTQTFEITRDGATRMKQTGPGETSGGSKDRYTTF